MLCRAYWSICYAHAISFDLANTKESVLLPENSRSNSCQDSRKKGALKEMEKLFEMYRKLGGSVSRRRLIDFYHHPHQKVN